jgi:hypothetical protein
MSARIVVFHDDPEFIDALAEKLGSDVAWFTDPIRALMALESAKTVAFLVARLQFNDHQPVGLSLARVTKAIRPNVQIILTGSRDQEKFASGIGEFIPEPVEAAHIAMIIEWLTERPGEPVN